MIYSMFSRRTLAPGEEEQIAKWKRQLQANPYQAYLYSYPHKTAYRPFDTPLELSQLWRNEPAETFFLYMHIPFCGARCGFCNLFTLPDKRADVHEQYVNALERQAEQWAPYVSHKPLARFAIGGGTPTLLEPGLLQRLFQIAEKTMGMDPNTVSISIETSPETVTAERLDILEDYQTDRVSMGIQSFIEAEANAIYRPQKPKEVERALDLLKSRDFPVLNLDLIYGLPGQTVKSWLYSLERTLAYGPEEIFLYPLYTREHTIVRPEQVKAQGEDIRLACYEAGRDLLLSCGYEQHSMRRFSKRGVGAVKPLLPYSCQEEGMIGLGCGARSYTREVHYASHYAVSKRATAGIIADYVASERYDVADYGIVLSEEEQKRRFIIKAILHSEGLSAEDYARRFASGLLENHPELDWLLLSGLATWNDGLVRLTEEGLAYSDAIGDWLISAGIRQRMEAFVHL